MSRRYWVLFLRSKSMRRTPLPTTTFMEAKKITQILCGEVIPSNNYPLQTQINNTQRNSDNNDVPRNQVREAPSRTMIQSLAPKGHCSETHWRPAGPHCSSFCTLLDPPPPLNGLSGPHFGPLTGDHGPWIAPSEKLCRASSQL